MQKKEWSVAILLKNRGAALAAFTVVPSYAISGLGHVAPSDKLNIAGIGVGGRGFAVLKEMTGQNISTKSIPLNFSKKPEGVKQNDSYSDIVKQAEVLVNKEPTKEPVRNEVTKTKSSTPPCEAQRLISRLFELI